MGKYNPDDVMGYITDLHSITLKGAKIHGLPTNNLTLYLNPQVADMLGFEDRIFLGDERTPLPIVRDSRIIETDFYMTNPDWNKTEDD